MSQLDRERICGIAEGTAKYAEASRKLLGVRDETPIQNGKVNGIDPPPTGTVSRRAVRSYR